MLAGLGHCGGQFKDTSMLHHHDPIDSMYGDSVAAFF